MVALSEQVFCLGKEGMLHLACLCLDVCVFVVSLLAVPLVYWRFMHERFALTLALCTQTLPIICLCMFNTAQLVLSTLELLGKLRKGMYLIRAGRTSGH